MTNTTSPSNQRQVAGQHYNTSYQHWDFAADARLGYFTGQITKYVFRWRRKKGVEDLEKALHFAEKLGELLAYDTLPRMAATDANLGAAVADRFCAANSWLTSAERAVIKLCVQIEAARSMGGQPTVEYVLDLRQLLNDMLAAPTAFGYVDQDR